MADLELDNAAIHTLKRPRDDANDDDAPSDSVQIADPSPATDDIAQPAKKLRPDDAVDADIEVSEQATEASTETCLGEAQDMAKTVEKTDVQTEKEGKADAGANTVRAHKEDLEVEEAAEDGGHLGEKVPSVEVQDGAKQGVKEVNLGPKVFTSSLDMFNFFYDLLRAWPINFNVNKYEHMMLEALISQGHQEPQKKIGAGIEAFQVRVNPEFYSRCYYVIRKDGSAEDFSYRKCVDNLMPLPDNMKSPSTDLKVGHKGQHGKGQHDNKGRGGRFGGGRGRGRGGRKRF